jgi:tetratricopeptide (TPR) repeat protein
MKKLTAEKMFGIGFRVEALNAFDELVNEFPSNPDYLTSRSIARTASGNLNGAISDQIKLLKLDPWNASNMLKLGENYKSLGRVEDMLRIRAKIESFASQTPEGLTARDKLIIP